MAETEYFDLPLPDEARTVEQEIRQLIMTLQMIDGILKSIRDTAQAASPQGHGHQLGDIAGLVDALASKMPASAAFGLDDLTDVSGAAAAPAGHVLAKLAGGWSPVSAAAAIGTHQHAMGDIAGLLEALAAKLGVDGGTVNGVLDAQTRISVKQGAGGTAIFDLLDTSGATRGRLVFHSSGTVRIGSLNNGSWVNSIVFSSESNVSPTLNDSTIVTSGNFLTQLNQQFYAGTVLPFALSSAPTGWLKCNGAAVSRAVYSRLFTAIGTAFGAGDGSTTFNLPDLRGEFVRGWDDGRGIDAGRAFGSAQLDAMQGHRHQRNINNTMEGTLHYPNSGSSGVAPNQWTYQAGQYQTTGNPAADGVNGEPRTAAETRSRNVALLWCIKW